MHAMFDLSGWLPSIRSVQFNSHSPCTRCWLPSKFPSVPYSPLFLVLIKLRRDSTETGWNGMRCLSVKTLAQSDNLLHLNLATNHASHQTYHHEALLKKWPAGLNWKHTEKCKYERPDSGAATWSKTNDKQFITFHKNVCLNVMHYSV